MITEKSLDFLRELALNNNREWFDVHRKDYQTAKKNIESTVNDLIEGIVRFDPGLAGLDAKKCMFRLFRDTRFSPNKSPYKTNLGAWMAPGGRKSVYGGYYFHVQPGGESFLAGGVYRPESATLKAIRYAIDYDAQPLRDIIAAKPFVKTFGELGGDMVKTSPKGYSRDHPDIDLIRYKDYVVSCKISDEDLIDGGFMEKAQKVYKAIHPLNIFLNKAIQDGADE